MSVPRLEDMVISKTVQQQWMASRLPELATSILTNSSVKSNSPENTQEIENVIKSYMTILTSYPIPGYLKERWTIIFNGLAREALTFFHKFRKALTTYKADEDNERIVKLLVFSQNCDIDTTKTILNILEFKEMKIKFSKKFLFDHMVLKDDLSVLLSKALNELEAKVDYRAPKIITKEREYLENYFGFGPYKDMKEICQQALQNKKKNFRDSNLGLPISTKCSKSPNLLKYWIQLACISEEDVMLYTNKLYKNEKVFPEVSGILLDYLGADKFYEATKEKFEPATKSVLGSWRNRHHWMEYLARLGPAPDAGAAAAATAFAAALAAFPPNLEEHAFCIVTQIFQHVWANIPQHVKNERRMYNSIPGLIKETNFKQEIFEMLLKDYDSVKSNAIFLSTVILAIKSDNGNKLTNLVKVAKNKHEVSLTKKQIKGIIDSRSLNICNKVTLDSLASLSCVEEARLKRSIARDIDLIKSFLMKNWGNNDVFEFFLWLWHGDMESANSFLRRVEARAVQPVFEHKLTHTHAGAAAAGLEALRLPLTRSLRKALFYKTVKADMITKMLDDAGNRSYFNPKNWDMFTSNQACMQKLLLSATGKQKIVEMLTNNKSRGRRELFQYFETRHVVVLERYQRIIQRLLEPAGMRARLDGYLATLGHPNANPEFDHLGDAERLDIDFRYRCFRALLTRDVSLPQVSWDKLDHVTLVSVSLAELAGVEVPVVL